MTLKKFHSFMVKPIFAVRPSPHRPQTVIDDGVVVGDEGMPLPRGVLCQVRRTAGEGRGGTRVVVGCAREVDCSLGGILREGELVRPFTTPGIATDEACAQCEGNVRWVQLFSCICVISFSGSANVFPYVPYPQRTQSGTGRRETGSSILKVTPIYLFLRLSAKVSLLLSILLDRTPYLLPARPLSRSYDTVERYSRPNDG